MFSTLSTRFGIPGVISVIALVFAMLGGAYAANNSSSGGKATASAKAKKGPRGPKGPKGATGPAGPQGPAGAQGPKGDTGAKGDTGNAGAPGAPGTSAEAVSFSGAKGGCTEGGSEVKSAKPTTFVCNGKAGSPWTAGGTLPSGKTETGTFAFRSLLEAGSAFMEPISFSIPLASPLGEGKVHLLLGDGSKEIIRSEGTGKEVDPTGCGAALTPTGTVANPTAAPGHLCVYLTAFSENVRNSSIIVDPSSECEALGCTSGFGGPGPSAGISGAVLQVFDGSDFSGRGTWAVTAP